MERKYLRLMLMLVPIVVAERPIFALKMRVDALRDRMKIAESAPLGESQQSGMVSAETPAQVLESGMELVAQRIASINKVPFSQLSPDLQQSLLGVTEALEELLQLLPGGKRSVYRVMREPRQVSGRPVEV